MSSRGTHHEHFQLVEVDAPEVTHVNGRAYTEYVKQVKHTQFKVGSWQVTDFEWLYFVGQACHGELNGFVLVN